MILYTIPLKQIFPGKELRGYPNSHIHVSVSDLFLWPVCLFCCRKIGGPKVGIYRSLTDTWMWKLQRWASTLASRSNARHRSKTELRSKGVKDRTFLTNRKQRPCPLPRSLSIRMSRDRLLHFQCKKTSCLLPLPSQRSKVVSINLMMLPFFKFKIWNFFFASFDAHLCFWLFASGNMGHGWDLCLSEREKQPRDGGRKILLSIVIVVDQMSRDRLIVQKHRAFYPLSKGLG